LLHQVQSRIGGLVQFPLQWAAAVALDIGSAEDIPAAAKVLATNITETKRRDLSMEVLPSDAEERLCS
jgi:hypothetical protein